MSMLAALVSVICSAAHAGVTTIPSIRSISFPSVATSGLPANPLPFNSSPFNPLTPSLIPSSLPSPSAAAKAANPSILEPFPARSLNTFWDGIQAPDVELEDPASTLVPLAGVPDSLGTPDRLAPWLETDSAKIALALDRAVALARTTRAGRRALDLAEKTLFSENRSLPVLVLDLGRNHGEFDYLARTMRLHSALFKPGREADLAGTIVHELTHLSQHAAGIPSNALEMELEAHLIDLELLAELGVSPRKGTFARQALDLLAQGPDKFIALIQAAVPGSIFLGDSSLDDILDQLEDDLSVQTSRSKRSKTAAALIPVIERDLDRLRTPAGSAAYRAFSRRVLALLKRRAAEAA